MINRLKTRICERLLRVMGGYVMVLKDRETTYPTVVVCWRNRIDLGWLPAQLEALHEQRESEA